MDGPNFFVCGRRIHEGDEARRGSIEADGRGDVTCSREKLVPPLRTGLSVHGGKAIGRTETESEGQNRRGRSAIAMKITVATLRRKNS
jgi:hypothetical protein